MRYACQIDYNGSAFSGWQRQNNAVTVQGEIESAISNLTSSTIQVTGCGRTDAGVHASNYVFHIDINTIEDFSDSIWIHKLNQMLPIGVAIRKIVAVDAEFHSRYDATSRQYRYRLVTSKPVFGYDHITYYKYQDRLDVDKLNEVAEMFLDATDFTAFSKLHGGNKTSICEITKCKWEQKDDGEYNLVIRANRFLRGMVRLIVGAHLNYHRGKLTIEDIRLALNNQIHLPIVWSVDSNGLSLETIEYPVQLFD